MHSFLDILPIVVGLLVVVGVLYALTGGAGRTTIKPSARELVLRPAYNPRAVSSNHPFPTYRSGRVVVLDTETTGLSASAGHRIVSFAAIELLDGVVTGAQQSFVFNPQRKCDAGAERVHGLKSKYLSKQEPFESRAAEIATFLGSAPIVAHNASFDIEFLVAEFRRSKVKYRPATAYCTMQMFKAVCPRNRKSLDAACSRLNVDASARGSHHGAFVDATLCTALFQILTSPEWPNASYTPIATVAPSNEYSAAQASLLNCVRQ